MAVTEILNALGSFEMEMSTTMPRDLLDRIEHFGHIAIVPGRVNPVEYGDNLLDVARYVGVVRHKRLSDNSTSSEALEDSIQISGCGMAFWLGDEDGKGDVIETPVELDQSIFPTAVESLLPDSVLAGDISHAVGNTFTGETATGVSTSLTADYIVVSDADAADITVGDDILLYNSNGDLKEGTIFTVTAMPSAFGFTNVEFSPNAAAVTNSGDQIRVGTFGTFSGIFQYQIPREAIHYLCQTMSSTSVPVTWRVNGDGTLDAGPHSELFVTTPTCTIIRKGISPGNDMGMRALAGSVEYEEDMEDFTTRVVMLAQGAGEDIATGAADIELALNTFKDVHGNALKLTRLVSESGTIEENADTRAALALNQYSSAHKEFTVSTEEFDIDGTFNVGDYVYLYDPDSGLVDTANELVFRGARLNPIKQQVTEATWNITEDFTVAYRDADGDWFDLTDNVMWESLGSSRLVVGDPTKQLIPSTESSVGLRTGIIVSDVVDTTTPNAPAFVTASFETVVYLDGMGHSRARQKLVWTTPTNTDDSIITDGGHYEIQFRVDTAGQWSQTWGALSTLTWGELGTWGQPVEPDAQQWQSLFVGWGENSSFVHELATGTAYDFRIRAVDKNANQSAWSAQENLTTSTDNLPPSTPNTPTVAASLIAVQVTHDMGKADGGTFNLENDLAHFEVHAEYEPGFTPTSTTMLGKLRANVGMMAAQTPAIGSFQIENTTAVYVKVVAVDISGNRSLASDAAEVTAELIDDAHISDLSVSKVTAGTISADWIVSGSIKTAEDGQRVELNSLGLQAFNEDGDVTTNLASDPSIEGQFMTFGDGDTTLASIDSLGAGSFSSLSATTSITLGGLDLLEDIIYKRGKGLVAWGDNDIATVSTSAGVEKGYMEIAFNAEENRLYRLSLNGDSDSTSSSASERYTWRIREESYNTPSTTSNLLVSFVMYAGGTAGQNTTGSFNAIKTFAAGPVRLLWCFLADLGTARMIGPDGPSQFYVEDIGSLDDFPDVTQVQDGTPGTDIPVLKTYEQEYPCTWSATYNGSGNYLSFQGNNLYQGQYSTTNDNQRSLAGFDYSQIMSDLEGATILKCEISLTATHWYFNSGGTAIIGTHDYSSRPSTWSGSRVDEELESVSGWKIAQKKTVSLGTTVGEAFQTGDARGIALGPGPSTSKTYYGRFAGNGSSHEPVLKITYKK